MTPKKYRYMDLLLICYQFQFSLKYNTIFRYIITIYAIKYGGDTWRMFLKLSKPFIWHRIFQVVLCACVRACVRVCMCACVLQPVGLSVCLFVSLLTYLHVPVSTIPLHTCSLMSIYGGAVWFDFDFLSMPQHRNWKYECTYVHACLCVCARARARACV